MSPLIDDFDSYMFPSTPTPPPPEVNPLTASVDWRAVESSQLYSPEGALVEPDKLYTGYHKHAILLFVPRQSVEICALVYAKCALLLQQASTRLIFITVWTPKQASTFLSRFEQIQIFPGSIICNPDASLFGAFGLLRSPLKALFASSKVSAPLRHGMRNALNAVSYLAQNRDIAHTEVSSKRLRCGAAVVSCLRGYAKRPDVRYLKEESADSGVGAYLDVLDVVGVNDAFVPDIDVQHVFTRFNSMRAQLIKTKNDHEKEERDRTDGGRRRANVNEHRNGLKNI